MSNQCDDLEFARRWLACGDRLNYNSDNEVACHFAEALLKLAPRPPASNLSNQWRELANSPRCRDCDCCKCTCGYDTKADAALIAAANACDDWERRANLMKDLAQGRGERIDILEAENAKLRELLEEAKPIILHDHPSAHGKLVAAIDAALNVNP